MAKMTEAELVAAGVDVKAAREAWAAQKADLLARIPSDASAADKAKCHVPEEKFERIVSGAITPKVKEHAIETVRESLSAVLKSSK